MIFLFSAPLGALNAMMMCARTVLAEKKINYSLQISISEKKNPISDSISDFEVVSLYQSYEQIRAKIDVKILALQ
jgi:hypothetical protein